jgi:hypothetical protein
MKIAETIYTPLSKLSFLTCSEIPFHRKIAESGIG